VEAVLAKHPAVVECSVFGVPDEKWGEAVHAAVRVSDGAAVTAGGARGLREADLGSVKAPKTIHFVAELPRNAAGKVSRAAVRGMLVT
jgi:acyl-coenzyme A synthetase/AMP-(fatty) acid ligase